MKSKIFIGTFVGRPEKSQAAKDDYLADKSLLQKYEQFDFS